LSESDPNELGEDGWEVVAVIPKVGTGNTWTYAPLKRPLMPKAKVTGRQAKI
jgi:hypothetical protein